MLHLLADVLMLATRTDPPRRYDETPGRGHSRRDAERPPAGLTGRVRA